MTLPRPFYEADGVTLYHGDAAQLLPHIGPYRRAILDPPYGFGAYEEDRAGWVPDALRIVRAQAETVAVFGYPETLVGWCVSLGWIPDEWVTWWPTNPPGGRGSVTKLPAESECIAVFGATPNAGELKRLRAYEGTKIMRSPYKTSTQPVDAARLGDVWRDPSPGRGFNSHLRQHPNEKSLDVLRKLVVLCSEPGETILDFACGSGTALIAAREHGRKAIGIEIDPVHCETAVRRLSQRVLDFGAPTGTR